MKSQEPKLPAVRSIVWLDLFVAIFGKRAMKASVLEENGECGWTKKKAFVTAGTHERAQLDVSKGYKTDPNEREREKNPRLNTELGPSRYE